LLGPERTGPDDASLLGPETSLPPETTPPGPLKALLEITGPEDTTLPRLAATAPGPLEKTVLRGREALGPPTEFRGREIREGRSRALRS